MTLAADALAYVAGFGWAVFPLRPGQKVPATRRGLHAATTDSERVDRWWQRHPRSNIGINCRASGLLVVDCDVKGDVDGLAAWLALGADRGPWLDTRVVSTPGGGEHWYFAIEPGWAIGNSVGRLAPGIDVRGRGGYVVAPSSVVAGSSYDVVSDRPLAPAPDWLIGLLVAPVKPPPSTPAPALSSSYARAALEGELGRLARARVGERNDTLVRAAYRMGQLAVGGQLDVVDVSARLLAEAQRIGLSRGEAQRTILSGLKAGTANPRSAA